MIKKKLLCDPPAMASAENGDADVLACCKRVDEMVATGQLTDAKDAELLGAVIAAEADYVKARERARTNFLKAFGAAVELYA